MNENFEIPAVTIVGRPNVGKSTLFNALTRSRKAIVADKAGVTRDRRELKVQPIELSGREIRIVDTGGWMPESWRRERDDATILRGIETQIVQGLATSSLVLLVVDLRAGLSPLDQEIAAFLRKQGHNFLLVCNKFDDDRLEGMQYDFLELGGSGTVLVSAEHRRGLTTLWEAIRQALPTEGEKLGDVSSDRNASNTAAVDSVKICIVGRPNVGKSSFLNCIMGEERVVESPIPGTTTDSVDIDLDFAGEKITLIDTAGIRRPSKRADDVEHLAVMYAKRNLERVDLAFLVIDSAEGITAQDAKIAELVEDSGAACVVIANKWDLAPAHVAASGDQAIRQFIELVRENMPFLDYAPLVGISAKNGSVYFVEGKGKKPRAVPDVLGLGLSLLKARDQAVPTLKLNEHVQAAMGSGPNIAQNVGHVYFAVRMPARSPVFAAYVRNPEKIPDSYRRFLARTVREHYDFRGNPVRWVFRRRNEVKDEAYIKQEYKKFRQSRDAEKVRPQVALDLAADFASGEEETS